MIASPADSRILAIHSETGEGEILEASVKKMNGCFSMVSDGTDLWMLPYSGRTVACWNPETGETREYSGLPDDFRCISRPGGYECEDKPFSWAVFYKNKVFLSPHWGNKFLILDRDTGHMEEWKPPFEILSHEKNGYYGFQPLGTLLTRTDGLGEGTFRFFSNPDRNLYEVSLETGEYREIPIEFKMEELLKHDGGFGEISEWLPYACMENAFHPLEKFLDGHMAGRPFDRQSQIKAYETIGANSDGTSGEKIHQFVRRKCCKF